jgi:lipid-A-disaccharide synthase
VEFISLANILSGREVVRELLQEDASADRIFNELRKILLDTHYRNSMISDLNKIRDTMSGKQPSSWVASIVGEMAGWNNAGAL